MVQTSNSAAYWIDRAALDAFRSPRSTCLALLRTADADVAKYLSVHPPMARVCLLRIQPRGTSDRWDGGSRALDGRPDRVERLIHSEPIWDLSPLGRCMVLGLGRNPDCQLKPAVDLRVRFFTQPHPAGLGYRDELDPAISREHAWVVCEGPARLAICMVGTPEAPGNGGWRNDEVRVQAQYLEWPHHEFFGVGQVCKNTPGLRPPYISIFRMRWTPLQPVGKAETRPEG